MSFEIGERVRFRSLLWEVASTSSEHSIKLFGRSTENHGRFIHVLLDIEDIQRAEYPELRWTIGKPGWDARQWKALHDAFRFTLSHSRGNLASVDWGRLILEPYQLAPLQRIESLPFPRLLIADDTGLGKTAEAGLILFRLMQKRRADRLLILCRAQPEPERWQRELTEKFGIETVVINDHEDVKRLRQKVPAHLNLFAYYPRIIMSMHYASQPHVMDDLRRNIHWDIAIIDEAHHVAEREGSSKRLSELGRAVADQSEALLLLTATPHDGKPETYASLLRLLDQYAVVDPQKLHARFITPLVVRRLKSDIEKADGSKFQQREIHVLEVNAYRTKAERYLDRGIQDYAEKLKSLSQTFKQQGNNELAFGAAFLGTFFKKRLASSVFACYESLQERLKTITQKATVLDRPYFVQAMLSDHADSLEKQPDELPSTEGLDGFQFDMGVSEVDLLHDLLKRAEKVEKLKEAKMQALLHLVSRCLASPNEKIVIFTEFRDTLDLVESVLSEQGYGNMIVTYHGATSAAEREANRHAFLSDPSIRIFLATDAASEGINLHKSCNTLIHIEVPWNPNRYEQRNGRIDRYGQQSKPQIYLLLSSRSVEQRMAHVVLQKLERIRAEVGSVSNVFPFAQRIKIDEFFARIDTAKVQELEDTLPEDTSLNPAIEEVAKQVEDLFDSLQETATHTQQSLIPKELTVGQSFGYQERHHLEQQLETSRSFVPEYQDVEAFLRVFMTLPDVEGGRIDRTQEPDVWSITVPNQLQRELAAMYGEPVERYPRATFQRDLALKEAEQERYPRVEFLSPGHPLIQSALRYMRGCAFKPTFASRVTYRRTPNGSQPGFLFTYVLRFVDGRGETIEERFEVIFVSLDGQTSSNYEEDMHLFTQKIPFGNVSEQEETNVLPVFQQAFDQAKEKAQQEVFRRRDRRVRELQRAQSEITDDALIRLGEWKKASEDMLQKRFADTPMKDYHVGGSIQLGLPMDVEQTPEQRRRAALFTREMTKLESNVTERRRDIQAMKDVRGETIDAIGALVLIPYEFSAHHKTEQTTR